jgi:CBS domain-containing membrane protein
MYNTAISNLMTTEVYTVDIHDPISKAQYLMHRYKIRHLPVLKKEKLVGILSQTDLQRLAFADDFGEMEDQADVAIFRMLGIRHVMKATPETISVYQTIREAAEILSNREFHALPVVEGDRVVGMVTTTDLIRFFIREMEGPSADR